VLAIVCLSLGVELGSRLRGGQADTLVATVAPGATIVTGATSGPAPTPLAAVPPPIATPVPPTATPRPVPTAAAPTPVPPVAVPTNPGPGGGPLPATVGPSGRTVKVIRDDKSRVALLRAGPTTREKVLAELPPDTVLEVLSEEKGEQVAPTSSTWYRVKWNDVIGYIYAPLVA
jgi:hypothetical protein